MVLKVRMPELKQRPGGSYTVRLKIPADVREDYTRHYGRRWSLKESWPKSLSRAEANRACAEWLERVNARFDALRAAREGRRRTLDHRETHALVGQWYGEYVGRYESNPGDPEGYERELHDFIEGLRFDPEDAEREADSLLSDPAILAAVRDDVAKATEADQWLMDHGHALTPESRAAFLDALAPRYADALALLIRRARGDFSHDPIRETFPTLEPPQAKPKAVSIGALFDQWIAEKKPAAGTVRRWQGVIDAAEARFPDLRKVTEGDARTWLKSLVTAERSAYTVNTIWRTALRTVCNWAREDGKLATSPFANIKIVVPRKNETRESKGFNDDEARTILAAALAIQGHDYLDNARRWLPWLSAYSGARAGEIAQMRVCDIAERNGIWAMTITPEAGSTKDRKTRTVPLHSHVLDLGFLDFVRARGDGPLFYDPRPDDGDRVLPPSGQVVKKVAEWVRSLGVDDPEIRPNHAWRHAFRLRAERADIPGRLIDVICGHKPASIGQAYGRPELSDLAREMAKFPRYKTEA